MPPVGAAAVAVAVRANVPAVSNASALIVASTYTDSAVWFDRGAVSPLVVIASEVPVGVPDP